MAEGWRYNFWRRRHERGDDIVKVHGDGRGGWIAYRRADALYLFGYDMGAKSTYGIWPDGVRQLTPKARMLSSQESLPLLEELKGALKGIEVK